MAGTDEVDYYTRNRLLGKIHNLTTNRSHLFACWIGVEFFEAHQVPVDIDGDGNVDTDGDGIPEALATQVGAERGICRCGGCSALSIAADWKRPTTQPPAHSISASSLFTGGGLIEQGGGSREQGAGSREQGVRS